jgi:hypothetical protein
LRGYVHYLDARKLKPKKISPATLIQKVKVAKRLLEYYDIDISRSKFKMKVKMPRSVQRQKSPLLQDAERPQEWLNESGRLEFDNLQVFGRLWQLRPRISKYFHPRT